MHPVNPWAPGMAFVLVASMVLAGCLAGSPGAKKDSIVPSTAPPAEHGESTGAVRGYVVDDEAVPVGGAELLVASLNATTLSAEDGGYTFSNLPPGQYAIVASKIGYAPATVSVAVGADQQVRKDIILNPLQVFLPHAEIYPPYDGYIQCRMVVYERDLWGFSQPCGTVCTIFATLPCVTTLSDTLWTQTKNAYRFQLSSPDWRQIVLEAKWQGGTTLTSPDLDMVFSYEERLQTHWFASSGPSPSPIKFTYTRGIVWEPNGQDPDEGTYPAEPNENLTLLSFLRVPYKELDPLVPATANVALEIKYEAYVTVFYSQNAPSDYSAFA